MIKLPKGNEYMKADVRIKKLREGAHAPTYGSAYAAGCDLYACLEAGEVEIQPGQTVVISTGWAFEIPEGFAGMIHARSGLATKSGLAPANKVGVIDSDYRGEVCVALHNHSGEARTVKNGDRVAQMVITPYLTATFMETDDLTDTSRGAGGFGSTGK
jgi:dUTP pyrophosphatase